MALSTHTELVTAINLHSSRTDISPLVDDFILLAEGDMYAPPDGSKPLKLLSMEAFSSETISSGRVLSMPVDYIGIRSVRINDNLSPNLSFRSPDQIKVQPVSGRPISYTVTSQIELDREVDGSYEFNIQYIKRLSPLTSSEPTNAILTGHPKIYLYGALYHAMMFAQEDQRAGLYLQQFVSAIRAANKLSKAGRFANSSYSPNGATP